MTTLKNNEIELTVRPDLGGRIDQLRDLQTGRNWLWHPETYDDTQTRSLSVGASFDDSWTGGWDEIFPNDAAGSFRGYELVDHGELWSQIWKVTESSPLSVQMSLTCQTVPVTVQKTVRLSESEPKFQIEYQFQNQSAETIPFLFKQHAAIAIEAGDEILLPDCLIEPVALGFSRLIGQQQQTRFPKALAADGSEVDLRLAPPRSSEAREFYYSFNLDEGRCGIYNGRSQSALVMQFDRADFPYVWVFQSYGGWLNHYVLVMEPCTTMPYDLEIAARNGTIAQLKPQETQRRQLTVQLQRGAR